MIKLSDVLLNPKKARRHPFEIVFLGFFYVSLSMLFSYWIFPDYASLFTVFLTVISCLYVVQGVLIFEEGKEKNFRGEGIILRGHAKTIRLFLLLFFGFLFAFIFWTIVLPQSVILDVFNVQNTELTNIRAITARAVAPENFSLILLNNLRVLAFSLVLALFYGAGSVFILAWNASIMGFVIGNLARNVLGLSSLPHLFLKYFLHGIPEMLAYFTAALAGGIIFISVIKGDLGKDRLKRTVIDSFILMSISLFLLIVAALLETFVSPMI